LKPEQWGSPLAQEKYQEEKACDKRHPYRIIIITRKKVQVPWDWGKKRHITSTNERKIETGIQQKIKNDTEI